jgi:hypothetical protein
MGGAELNEFCEGICNSWSAKTNIKSRRYILAVIKLYWLG